MDYRLIQRHCICSPDSSHNYVRDVKTMAATPADVKEYKDAYSLIIDMPGLKSSGIKVQVEDDNELVISGERKREEEKENGAKYLRMERRVGKFMRKFVLPDNADLEEISAVSQDGVCFSYCPEKTSIKAQEAQEYSRCVGAGCWNHEIHNMIKICC